MLAQERPTYGCQTGEGDVLACSLFMGTARLKLSHLLFPGVMEGEGDLAMLLRPSKQILAYLSRRHKLQVPRHSPPSP